MVSKVHHEDLLYYREGRWNQAFWYGVNLGATTPGHMPGELSPGYEDYMRWLKGIEGLGVQTIRIYTILPPCFYQALVDFNETAQRKIWFIQGVWPPDEALLQEKDAYLPEIMDEYDRELALAVKAVYGKADIKKRPGHAYGEYKVNAAPYLLAWMTGAEWEPEVVVATNEKNPQKNQYRGKYFCTTAAASPFEAWLARSLDVLAREEMKQDWQHPAAFVNWVTTDPLMHPDEPFPREDMVGIDPAHVAATGEWEAGYYAAYHVYPYYPDSLRYQREYQVYTNAQGEKDPYEAYLHELRKHHAGMPLLVAEFGVPSSRGIAHYGPLGRHQGMHTEYEQGEMEIAMLKAMKRAGVQGGIIFEWQDEWFKFTWNTINLEIPSDRRAMWLNRLTNEENFGLLAVEPGLETKVILDGQSDDWHKVRNKAVKNIGSDGVLMITSDEAYVYLGVEFPRGSHWLDSELLLGFDNQPGGNTFVLEPEVHFPGGLEFLLSFEGNNQAVLQVASAYDQHSYLYGYQNRMAEYHPAWEMEDNGLFLPWKLCVSYPLYLPASRLQIPFTEVEIGKLRAGTTDPASSAYDSLADYYRGENLLEIRIPWMLLGYTDPSSHKVWAYPYRNKIPYLVSTRSPGLNVHLALVKGGDEPAVQMSVYYDWDDWDVPTYHERQKQSYYMIKDFLASELKDGYNH